MKRLLALMLSVLMLALPLAGCAGTDAPKTTEPPKTTAAPAATDATQAAQPTDAAPAEGDLTSWIINEDTSISGKVRFWIPFKGEQGMNALIEEFNSYYPNIEVELTTYNNNTDGNTSVNAAVMSGEVDVLASFNTRNVHTRWENGLYEDITDRIAAEGIDLVANWGTDAYSYDGRYYTLPCGGRSFYVAINMDAWNEAGLGELPTEWTWDEYLEACRAMTKTDGDRTVYGGSQFQSVWNFTYSWFQVYGTDNYYGADGLSNFTDPMITNALSRQIQAEAEGIWFPFSRYAYNNDQTHLVYTSGEVASCITTNLVRFLADRETYPVTWKTGFAPWPTEEPGQDNYMSGIATFSHAGIATGCQDEDAAWAFLKFYATYGSKYLYVAGHASTWKGTQVDDVVSLIFGSREAAEAVIDVDSYQRVVANPENLAYVELETTAYSQVDAALREYAQYAMDGQMTVEEAMAAAKAQADAAIQDAQS